MTTIVASFAPHIIAQTEYTEPPQEAVSTYDLGESQVSEEIPLATDDDLIDSSSYEETLVGDETTATEEVEGDSVVVDESIDETDSSEDLLMKSSEEAIDVVSTASTVATIDDWITLNQPISQTSTNISGKINMPQVYQQVFNQQPSWIASATTKDKIAAAFQGQKLQLIINGEPHSVLSLNKSTSSEYNFDFTGIDLSDKTEVTFRMDDAPFKGETKPSSLVLKDVDVSFAPAATPLGFGSVGDFEFEPQTFSYHLGNEVIEQSTRLKIEIIGSNSSAYSLSASNSGTLHYEDVIVDIKLFYGDVPIDKTPVKIFEGKSPDSLTFEDFKLRISNPSKIVAGQDYTTTITWTLTNAN